MNHNPNKTLGFFFSLFPGVGQMYLGLMRRGISILTLFFADIAFIAIGNSFFRLGVLVVIPALLLPLIWFFSAFDFWHFIRLLPEEAANVKDAYLFFSAEKFPPLMLKPLWFGAMLVVAGVLILTTTILNSLHIPWEVWLERYNIPQIAAALGLIALGLYLILKKRRQLRDGS
ncbi:MAG: hypothetical protein FWH26_10570 [Oscillospiraceae bacterium]|nr:hypothetical protein [Oscillospiraceae bacterium]